MLFRSYWLLYVIYLLPFITLGIMVMLVLLIGLHWRDLGGAIGFQLARNRMMKRRRSRWSTLVWVVCWIVAVMVLVYKPGSIFNPIKGSNKPEDQILGKASTGAPDLLKNNGILPTLSTLVQNDWFYIAFAGLLVVGGLVLVQSVRVALKETSDATLLELEARRVEGLQAVQDAIKLIDDTTEDPRTRIISCYQRMLSTVSRLGAPVAPDQTARELETAIRSTLSLKGPATSELTQLFEEARYSLHEITDLDATKARENLDAIALELNVQVNG